MKQTVVQFHICLLLLCLIIKSIDGGEYGTIGKTLISSLSGGGLSNGESTTGFHRSNDQNWGRGDDYEQYGESSNQRMQSQSNNNNNQGMFSSMNRNNDGKRDSYRSGSGYGGQSERFRW